MKNNKNNLKQIDSYSEKLLGEVYELTRTLANTEKRRMQLVQILRNREIPWREIAEAAEFKSRQAACQYFNQRGIK